MIIHLVGIQSQAIEETGGREILSIYDEWQNDIDRLAEATVTYQPFPLSLSPIEDSIPIDVITTKSKWDIGIINPR